MKKLSNGISNYEELIEDGYLYVDKTPYIEKLEKLTDKRIMFLDQENSEKHYLQVS